MGPDSINCDKATLMMLLAFSMFNPWGACIAAAAYMAVSWIMQQAMIESQSDDGR